MSIIKKFTHLTFLVKKLGGLSKLSLVAVLALALVLGTGAGAAQAALTLGATSTASDGALTLTGATASTWSTAAGALTITGTGGLTLDSATTTAVNLGTAAAAKTITIGNDASTKVDVNALAIELDSAGTIILDSTTTTVIGATTTIDLQATTGLTIDSAGATAIGIGTDANTGAINVGTAGARIITVGNAAVTQMNLVTDALGANAVNITGTVTTSGGITVTAGGATIVGTFALDAGEIGTAELANAAVTSAKLDEGTIKYAEVALSNAQIKALFTTPIEVVAAPGAGKVVSFVDAIVIHDVGAADFATAHNVTINYGATGTGAAVSTTLVSPFISGAVSDKISTLKQLTTDLTTATKADWENQPLTIKASANPITGDGVGRVKVWYRIFSTGL